MRMFVSTLFSLTILSMQPALAAPAPDALSECMREHTSGKDRKDMARWIFVSMSVHPDMRQLAAADDAARIDADKTMAAIVTRLLTQDCVAPARLAMQVEGGRGMTAAFQALGEAAMTELRAKPEVSQAIGAFTQYLDKKKFEEALRK